MKSANVSIFPTPQTPLTSAPKSKETSPSSARFLTKPNGEAGMVHREDSFTLLETPQPIYSLMKWTMRTPPSRLTGISASPTSTKNQNNNPRRRGDSITRSITGPFTRFFHPNGKDDVNENGMDFVCCGEAPPRPPRRAGWLGTLELDEMPASCVAIKGSSHEASGAVGVLGSPWCPDINRVQVGKIQSPFGGSPPPLTSSDSSPASAEASLASPSYFRGPNSRGSPVSYFTLHEATSLRFTSPQKDMSESLGGAKAGPTRRVKISIDTISAPRMQDINAPKNQH